MSVTIMEALQNADYNLQNNGNIGLAFAKEQVKNAVGLLDKGYTLETSVDDLIEEHNGLENVPEKV